MFSLFFNDVEIIKDDLTDVSSIRVSCTFKLWVTTEIVNKIGEDSVFAKFVVFEEAFKMVDNSVLVLFLVDSTDGW